MSEKYCKGSFMLNTACGKCFKCQDEIRETMKQNAELKEEIIRLKKMIDPDRFIKDMVKGADELIKFSAFKED